MSGADGSSARRAALHAFLSEARDRIKPQDVGLPSIGFRRVRGLRQSEVAELAGVSTRWYVQFEDGSPSRRFSVGFVQRVADALCLSDRERATLFRLALPEIRVALEQFEQAENDGILASLATIRDLARRLTALSSFDEAAEAAAQAVETILSPSCLSIAALLPDHRRRIIAFGRNAVFANVALAEICIEGNYQNRFGYTTIHEHRHEDNDELPEETLTPKIPHSGGHHDAHIRAEVYSGWNSKIQSRSSLTHGLFGNGVYNGNLGALWTEPHAMSSFEIETLRTASALAELAAAAPLGHRWSAAQHRYADKPPGE